MDPTGTRLRRWRRVARASSVVLVVLLLVVLAAALSGQHTRLPEPLWAPTTGGRPVVPPAPTAVAV